MWYFVLSTLSPFFTSAPNSPARISGKLLFFSGKTGMVLKSVTTPDAAETYCSPVIYLTKNGTEMVVFGTGGETHSGHLYAVQLSKLYKGELEQAVILASNSGKGRFYTFCIFLTSMCL